MSGTSIFEEEAGGDGRGQDGRAQAESTRIKDCDVTVTCLRNFRDPCSARRRDELHGPSLHSHRNMLRTFSDLVSSKSCCRFSDLPRVFENL